MNHPRECFLGAGILNRSDEVSKLSIFPDHKLNALSEGMETCRLSCAWPCDAEHADLVVQSTALLHVHSFPAINSLISRHSKGTIFDLIFTLKSMGCPRFSYPFLDDAVSEFLFGRSPNTLD
jgi:hypothetical protein